MGLIDWVNVESAIPGCELRQKPREHAPIDKRSLEARFVVPWKTAPLRPTSHRKSLSATGQDALYGTSIDWMSVRHEESAAFAAAAEAGLTDELAVCAGSCGPGNLHLINGLYDAQRSRVPVLAIAAHIPAEEIGTGYFQETHPQDLFRECSVYVEHISDVGQLPRVLTIAIRTAIEQRGVAVVVISGSMANGLPMSLGAQAAFSDRQIISLSGDGGCGHVDGGDAHCGRT